MRVRAFVKLVVLVGLVYGAYRLDSYMRENHLRLTFVHEQPNLADVNKELSRSQTVLTDAVQRATEVASTLVTNSRKQQQEMVALQSRYDTLKGLTSGQEEIARAHRAILQERTMHERIIDAFMGFVLGVASSLAASMIWAGATRKA